MSLADLIRNYARAMAARNAHRRANELLRHAHPALPRAEIVFLERQVQLLRSRADQLWALAEDSLPTRIRVCH
jgi:hypothetical protein